MAGLRHPGSDAIAPAVLAVVAAAAASVGVGSKSLWLDEATSATYVRLPGHAFLEVLTRRDPNMSLYYLLLRVWADAFGDSESALRSLSVVCAASAVAVTYFLGRRLFGAAVGFVAALLLAVNPFFVQYAQEARGYTLLALLVASSSYFLVRELEEPSRIGGVGLTLTASLGVYAHYFAFYILFVDVAVVIAVQRRAAFTRHWFRVAGATSLLSAPAIVLAQRRGASGISWIAPPTVSSLWHLPVTLAGDSRLALLLLLASGSYGLWRAVRNGDWRRQAIVASWLVVPLLLSFLASFWQPMFISYYLIVVVPALCLFAAVGIGTARTPFAVVVLAVLLAEAGAGLHRWYRSSPAEDWRATAQFVLAASRPGDQIIFVPDHASQGFDYYERRATVSLPVPVTRAGPKTERIWIVLRTSDVKRMPADRQVEDELGSRYRVARQRTFAGTEADLYVRRRP